MSQNARNKQSTLALWETLDRAPADAAGMLSEVTHWQAHAPVGVRTNGVAIIDALFAPLKTAMPQMERQIHLFLGGQSSAHESGTGDGAWWTAGAGYLSGIATGPLFGIPASEQPIRIRWGEFLRFDAEGNITHAQTIWDLIDWLDQIDLPVLPKPKGAAHVFPAATGYDGILLDEHDNTEGQKSLSLGRQLIFGGLNKFDETDLTSMGMKDFFHPNIKWYGPGGIGACLSLIEFERLHQQPWLVAFPDRKVKHLESLFAEDQLVAASGPMGVVATHTGPYLGHPASGKPIEVSGLDFWLRREKQFTENWVFVDMIHLFEQMGIDLLAEIGEQR